MSADINITKNLNYCRLFVRDEQINIEKIYKSIFFGKTAENKLKCCADYRSTKTVYTVD